jgi:4-hydroxybenzoate polyprenyltransferase
VGIAGALWISGALHVVTAGCLVALPAATPLAWPYWLGLAAIVGVLAYEHWLVRPDDLSKIGKAFFDLNGYVSLLFLGGVVGGWWLA